MREKPEQGFAFEASGHPIVEANLCSHPAHSTFTLILVHPECSHRDSEIGWIDFICSFYLTNISLMGPW